MIPAIELRYLLLVLFWFLSGVARAAIDTRFTSTTTTTTTPKTITTTTEAKFAELVTPAPRTKAAQANRGKWRKVFKDYEKYMKASPRKSFIINKRATIDCQLNKELEDVDYQLSWLKLNRSTIYERHIDSQLLIGLNDRVISPDPRYKIFRENATVWHLTIDDLREEDGAAYYFCQPTLATNASVNSKLNKPGIEFMYAFQRGVKLQVLTPPEINLYRTSFSQVFANEYQSLTLNCSTYSLTKGQHTWLREDKRQHEGQLVVNEYQGPSPVNPSLNVWHTSSALIFDTFTREQAGVYHCTTQNGIEPGKRIRVEVFARKCRVLETESSPDEPCSKPRYIPGQTDPAVLDEQELDQVTIPTTRRPDTTQHTGWRTRPPTTTMSTSDNQEELTTLVAQEVAEEGEEQYQGGEIGFVIVSDGTICTSVPTLWLISLMIALNSCLYLFERRVK